MHATEEREKKKEERTKSRLCRGGTVKRVLYQNKVPRITTSNTVQNTPLEICYSECVQVPRYAPGGIHVFGSHAIHSWRSHALIIKLTNCWTSLPFLFYSLRHRNTHFSRSALLCKPWRRRSERFSSLHKNLETSKPVRKRCPNLLEVNVKIWISAGIVHRSNTTHRGAMTRRCQHQRYNYADEWILWTNDVMIQTALPRPLHCQDDAGKIENAIAYRACL